MGSPSVDVREQRLSPIGDIVSDWFGRPKKGEGSSCSGADSYVTGLGAGLEELFASRGVDVTPTVSLRAMEVITWAYIAREIQGTVSSDGVTVQEEQKEQKKRKKEEGASGGTDADAATTTAEKKKTDWRLHPAVEALAKTWERLRKAMKELEDTCKNAGTPVNKGLPDIVKPLLEKTEGILEEALEHEKKRRAKNRLEQAATE